MTLAPPPDRPVSEARWAELIPLEQWAVYQRVMDLARDRGIPYAVGGGIAFSHYARRWRNTKDLDLYIRPWDRDAMIQVTRDCGLSDYREVHGYDERWIYRSHDRSGTIVDIIWQMANYRASVDDEWLSRGEHVRVRGMEFPLLAPEELLWSKLYVVQRDRCDWGDLLNILFSAGTRMDWPRLIARVGDDRRILAALLQLFTWACPGAASALPITLWKSLGLSPPEPGAECDPARIRLLDSRDWFGPR